MTKKKDLSQPTNKPMIETCHLGDAMHQYERDSINELSYIHEHLTTLNFIVTELDIHNVLEIGTGPGESLCAMLEGNNAHVTTIDIEDCQAARLEIEERNLDNRVTFIQGNSDDLNIGGMFDLVLIDGGHTYEQVKKDIWNFEYLLKPNGFIIFHDMTNPAWPGVKKAVEEFHSQYSHFYKRYNWFNCNGLTVYRGIPNHGI